MGTWGQWGHGDSGDGLQGALLAPAQPGRVRLGFTERSFNRRWDEQEPSAEGHIWVLVRSPRSLGPPGDSPAGVGVSGAAPAPHGHPLSPATTAGLLGAPGDASPGTPECDPQVGTVGRARSSGWVVRTPVAPQSCPCVPEVAWSPHCGGRGRGGRPGAAAAALPPSPGPREAEGSRRPFPSSLPLCHLRHWHSRQKRAWALTSSVLREGDTGICFLPLQLHGEAKLLF